MKSKKLTKGGCLKAALIGIGVIIIIGLALPFGWIAGAVWLIFFRKRLTNPETQKRATITVSALSIASFIFMVYAAVSNPSLKSITISAETVGQGLEVGQDYVINIECSPKDAKTSSLIYNVDGSCATFSKSNTDNNKAILHTTAEGKALISVSSGEIHSNTLEFTIVNKDAEELPDDEGLLSDGLPESTGSQEAPGEEGSETEPEAPPEVIDGDINITFSESIHEDTTGKWRLARVATAKEIQAYALEYYNAYFQSDDEIHAIVNFTLGTTYKLAKVSSDTLDIVIHDYVEGEELDANILFSGTVTGNYQINIATGEISQISLEPEATEEGEPSNNEPSTPEESANAPEATPETPIPAEPSADMVWIDDTGKKYHSKSSCSNMSDPYQITRQEAEAMGRGACKKCY